MIPNPQLSPRSILIWKSNQRTLSGGIQITLQVATEGQRYGTNPLKINMVSSFTLLALKSDIPCDLERWKRWFSISYITHRLCDHISLQSIKPCWNIFFIFNDIVREKFYIQEGLEGGFSISNLVSLICSDNKIRCVYCDTALKIILHFRTGQLIQF